MIFSATEERLYSDPLKNADPTVGGLGGVGSSHLQSTSHELYRLTSPDAPNPTAWDWSWGGIFLILGLGGFSTLNISWPLILILVGGVILASVLRQRD